MDVDIFLTPEVLKEMDKLRGVRATSDNMQEPVQDPVIQEPVQEPVQESIMQEPVVEQPKQEVEATNIPLPPRRPEELTATTPEEPVSDKPRYTLSPEYAAKLEKQKEYVLGKVAEKKEKVRLTASEKTKDLVADQEFMNNLRYTYKDLYGDEGIQAKDETDIEYFNRFMSSRHRAFMTNEIDAIQLMHRIQDTDERGKLAFGKVYSTIEEKAPSMFNMSYEEGAKWYEPSITMGDQSIPEMARTVLDNIYFSAYSPSSVISLGAGILTGGGSTAVTTPLRQGIMSRIRRAIINKSTVTAGISGSATAGLGDLSLQQAERLSRVDPNTGVFDPNVSPDDLDLNYTRAGIVAGVTAIPSMAEGATGRKFRQQNMKDIASRLANINSNVAAKAAERQRELIEQVAGNPETGRQTAAILELAETVDAPLAKGVSPKKLMDTVSESFTFVDNVPDKELAEAYRAVSNPKMYAKMAEVSVYMQLDLNKKGLLPALGQRVVDTFTGYRPNRTGISSITQVIADGLDGIDKILIGGRDIVDVDNARLKRFAVKLTDQEAEDAVDSLEAALKSADVSPKEFVTFMSAYTDGYIQMPSGSAKGTAGDLVKAQVAESAKLMAGSSNAAKIMLKNLGPLMETDPVLKKLIETRYAVKNNTVGLLDTGISTLRQIERARISTMTSQLITTARNAKTGLYTVGQKTGADFVDSFIFHTGQAVKNIATGNISLKGAVEGTGKGIVQVIDDTFSTLTNLTSGLYSGRGTAVLQASLSNNPRAMNRLLRYQSDISGAADTKIGKAVQGYTEFINQLNSVTDAFYRRSFYLNSLDRRFKNLMRQHKATHGTEYMGGKYRNVFEFVEDGNVVDNRLVLGAVDDALKETFSYTPKHGEFGHTFVKAMESFKPLSSLILTPFARFTVGAIKHTWDYSPFSVTGKIIGNMNRRAWEKEQGSLLERLGKTVLTGDEMRQAWGKSTVGTAMFIAADHYLHTRDQGTPVSIPGAETLRSLGIPVPDQVRLTEVKSNIPWNEIDGVTQDAEFPVAPYLAFAYLVRVATGKEQPVRFDVERAMSMLTSLNARQLDQTTSVIRAAADKLTQLDKTEGDSVGAMMKRDFAAEALGDIVGSFLTPLRQLKDLSDAFSVEPTITDVPSAFEEADFEEGVAQQMARGLPTEAFGYDLREQEILGRKLIERKAPLKNFLLFPHHVKHRNKPILRFVGRNYGQKQTDLERTIRGLGIDQSELLPKSGASARVYNAERQFYATLATEGLTNMINSPKFKQMSVSDKKAYILENIEDFKEQARADAKDYSMNQGKEKFDAAAEAFKNLPKNATKEEMYDAIYTLQYYAHYGIVSDHAKNEWLSESKEYNVKNVEEHFREMHFKTLKKLESNPEEIDGVEWLYLRGETIADQRTFGLATKYSKFLRGEVKQEGQDMMRSRD